MKYKKKDMLNDICTLDKVNQIMKTCNSQKIYSMGNVLDVLIDCQNTAIQVGTYLESLGDRTKHIVKQLEDYCENIYQQSVNLNNIDVCRKISETIQTQLSMIASGIKYDLPEDRKEVVFLPYKASMWDSLESIWMAAMEDENCDAYVVPIPYYEKKVDGSFGEMHYEGKDYPTYVPIVDWREYNLEERKPDMIFIHNPYDDWNLVASIHPSYYAMELKKHTGMLVYVPYFISIKNQTQEHFCITKGVLVADRVIVDSEEVKKIYINALKKMEKEHGCYGKFGDFEEKILPLGSPKIDRVKNMKYKKLEIPNEWMKYIINSEGKYKKIVFYNTTIDAILNKGEIMLYKIKSVIKTFLNNKETVILWRPHPLLEATIKAMRPALYVEYKAIVEEFKNEGIGIFDDTPDVERAIELSDAYYGDMSSVVELYKITGKPILIQNEKY